MRFSVNLEGVESAVENLDLRIDALKNTQEYFDGEGGEIIRKHQVEVMMTQGHGDWPPLAQSTIKQAKYRRRGSNHPFDTYSRKMWHDLTREGAAHHIHEATKDTLKEGTDNPIAHYHIKRRTRPTHRTVTARVPRKVKWRQAGQWVLPMRKLVYWTQELIGRFTAGLMAFWSGRERVKGYHRKGVARYGR